TNTDLPAGPWIVKGQITAGGRGKAGIIKKAATANEVATHAKAILGTHVKNRTVESVRIEQQVAGATEAYLSLMVDAAAGGVRVIMAAEGGMEIETLPQDAIRSEVAAPDIAAIINCVEKLAASFSGAKAQALKNAGTKLAQAFMACEAMLIEINPLFVKADGSWVAGDAKFVTDDGALERQENTRAMLHSRAAAYPEAALKLEHGCDYVVVDPDGELGLLTTGAGLSMMLIDELRAMGMKPYNFLDVRTGGLRGETTRLVKVLKWISEGPNIKVMLINIFAGITELGEFSRLLVKALSEAPELKVPVVARLVGNGLPAAREVLGAAGIAVYPDLDDALAEVRRHLEHHATKAEGAK
ncbi:MAG: ATP-grasp domain-containing protein, partial [Burkholderiales bacterium]